jgi:hypothetical protein
MPLDYSFKDNFQEVRNPTNIEFVDWVIAITAVCTPLLFIVSAVFDITILFVVIFILSCVLVIIATKRLVKNKIVKLWQRIIVFMISIYFNPITWMIYLMIFVIILKPFGPDYKTKRINKRKFSLACSEIILNKNKYKEEYTNNFSELPEVISRSKPIHVWIGNTNVKIAVSRRPSQGWNFTQYTNGNWTLYSYFDGEKTALKSGIIINTNNGQIYIPDR